MTQTRITAHISIDYYAKNDLECHVSELYLDIIPYEMPNTCWAEKSKYLCYGGYLRHRLFCVLVPEQMTKFQR